MTLGAVAGALLAPALGALADMPEATSMTVGADTRQPIGHYDLCIKDPDECRKLSPPAAARDPSPEEWETVVAVNSAVNARIVQKPDRQIYGVEELWTYPDVEGDCEDFALLKRRELAGKGWPLADLLLTTVRKQDGEGHAVLTVRTARGDFVLDNLDGRVRPWNEIPYIFVKRQSSTNSGRWVSIEAGRDIPVGSVR
ncbi:transglutaminase-like cysteine peptidase [Rhizobium sp. NTR19]|uniref:Transglutaminase-like cysteine peptidase n=1 Tax=Neorhizobium turbinariae TaxID=2937795 RepID=A0ABT0ISJ1_9HYPH|nr:transglutaminase-like cysteine peptidase [Neorhizobium turbinariae]MCK8780835.1 transglutaminase-like cysteine peptidase [Neorhizobium turbinariae]